ncbi:hypothetical protein SDC9_97508 [bioreactor metagenome]|uniref:Uncharacterized protein n=1 Tax=bioreactor metagenome TaxID=1076179 RepID=A0A645AC45_9ZZZZ
MVAAQAVGDNDAGDGILRADISRGVHGGLHHRPAGIDRQLADLYFTKVTGEHITNKTEQNNKGDGDPKYPPAALESFKIKLLFHHQFLLNCSLPCFSASAKSLFCFSLNSSCLRCTPLFICGLVQGPPLGQVVLFAIRFSDATFCAGASACGVDRTN